MMSAGVRVTCSMGPWKMVMRAGKRGEPQAERSASVADDLDVVLRPVREVGDRGFDPSREPGTESRLGRARRVSRLVDGGDAVVVGPVGEQTRQRDAMRQSEAGDGRVEGQAAR